MKSILFTRYRKITLIRYLFNSNLGKIYEINSNLKTTLLLKTKYDDPLTMKRIEVNLKFLKIDPNDDLNKIIKENDKVLNNITVD